MNYWQVASGEGARDFYSVFLDFGVMCIGAGDPGPYFQKREYYKGRPWGSQVVRFAEEVSEENVVILKKPAEGRWLIRAVGRVKGPYDYLEQFSDVEGWDLQHCREVEWSRPKERLVTDGLVKGTFKRVRHSGIKELAAGILETGEVHVSEEIPPPAGAISDEDLVEHLIGNGLRPGDAETVIHTIWRVRRLARWYEKHGEDLGEHEIRTFLIVPILLALGWSEQKMKIEWRNTDLSLFSHIYSRGDEPCMIVESKRMGEGLDYAERQVVKYAHDFPSCRHIIVSDGIRYNLYIRQDNQWDMKQDFKAYMNLLKLKDRHPYLVNVKGAPDLFINLMPQ